VLDWAQGFAEQDDISFKRIAEIFAKYPITEG
jgi:hypothetical protein